MHLCHHLHKPVASTHSNDVRNLAADAQTAHCKETSSSETQARSTESLIPARQHSGHSNTNEQERLCFAPSQPKQAICTNIITTGHHPVTVKSEPAAETPTLVEAPKLHSQQALCPGGTQPLS